MDPDIHNDRDPIDVFVGARVRVLRKVHGLTQQALAARLGISFQQVQKYEKGANRISAAMLYRIAALFGLPIGELFDGLPADLAQPYGPPPRHDGASSLHTLLDAAGGASLAETFLRMPAALRGPFLEIARAMAQAGPALGAGQPQAEPAAASGPISPRPRPRLAVSAS